MQILPEFLLLLFVIHLFPVAVFVFFIVSLILFCSAKRESNHVPSWLACRYRNCLIAASIIMVFFLLLYWGALPFLIVAFFSIENALLFLVFYAIPITSIVIFIINRNTYRSMNRKSGDSRAKQLRRRMIVSGSLACISFAIVSVLLMVTVISPPHM